MWKIVCNICQQEHSGPFNSQEEAVDALHEFNVAAVRRGVPPQLLSAMQIVPADHIYVAGNWRPPAGGSC
jgi:DNA-binding helix-hairpin-helix protein with protein kinase domain